MTRRVDPWERQHNEDYAGYDEDEGFVAGQQRMQKERGDKPARVPEPEPAKIVLHLKTQDDQPYGSHRRCCERCGVMLWGQAGEPPWTDDREVYEQLPPGFTRCDAQPQ